LTVAVFFQILLVVPEATPGGGATVLKILKMLVSVDDASLFVVVSPKTTVLPTSPGLPFQIWSVNAVKGVVAPAPVRYP